MKKLYEKNELGYVYKESYYNADCEAVIVKSGYAVVKKDYNEKGDELSERYFGLNDEPVLTISGYHRVEKEYPNVKHVMIHVNPGEE